MATPGIDSVEAQGPAAPGGADAGRGAEAGATPGNGHAGPPPVAAPAPTGGGAVPARRADGYSVRLVSGRRLYDRRRRVLGACRALAALVAPAGAAGPSPATSTGWASAPGRPVRVRSGPRARSCSTRGRRAVARGVASSRLQPRRQRPSGRLGPDRRPPGRGRHPPGVTVTAGLPAVVGRLLGIGTRSSPTAWRWAVLLIVVVKVVVAFAVLMVVGHAHDLVRAQGRSRTCRAASGPTGPGPFGLLQTLADGIKLFFKEDLHARARPTVSSSSWPRTCSVVPAFLTFAIVPLGGTCTIVGHHVSSCRSPTRPMGILFMLAMSSISVYGVMLAGWSSGSKYPLLGSVRASAQMISLRGGARATVVTVVLVAGRCRRTTSSTAQAQRLLALERACGLGLVPFVRLHHRRSPPSSTDPPFDLVEAEASSVGGFHTEYSSIRFAIFFLAEFMNTITMSAIIVTLFFGGPTGPGPARRAPVVALCPSSGSSARRSSSSSSTSGSAPRCPRFRYDQLMDLGWKGLIPLSLGLDAARRGRPGRQGWGFGDSSAVIIALDGLLARAVDARPPARARRRAALPAVGERPMRRADGPAAVTDRGGAEAMGVLQTSSAASSVTLQQLARPRVTTSTRARSGPSQPRLHGRHVLNRYEDGMEKCIGCELCAGVCPADCIYVRGADNPPDDPVVARRALRLRLRDQLPALHPLRPVRRGVPDRGDHRVQAVRVLLHQPRRRHLHQGRARSSTTTASPSACPGRTGARARTAITVGLDAGHLALGRAAYEGEVQWSGELGYGVRAPEGGQRGERDDAATGIERSATSSRPPRRTRTCRRPARRRGGASAECARADGRAGVPGSTDRRPPTSLPASWSSRPRRLLILVGRVGVVIARNPVHAALSS